MKLFRNFEEIKEGIKKAIKKDPNILFGQLNARMPMGFRLQDVLLYMAKLCVRYHNLETSDNTNAAILRFLENQVKIRDDEFRYSPCMDYVATDTDVKRAKVVQAIETLERVKEIIGFIKLNARAKLCQLD